MNRNLKTASICLNVILLGIFVYCLKTSSSLSPVKPKAETAKAAQKRIVRIARTTPPATVETSSPKFDWRTLESEDYPTYMANLRAIHCPEKTIFDIVFADIEKLYTERKNKLETGGRFWTAGDAFEKARLEKEEKLFEWEEEKRTLIKTLLNSDLDWEAVQDWYKEKEIGMFLGFLPDSKPEHVLSVAKKYVDLFKRVKERADGLTIPEDAVENKKIYSEMMIALGQLVSPADLEEGEMRMVCLISYLFSGGGLKESGLSGAELRHLMKLKYQLDNPFLHELEKYNGSDSAPELLGQQKYLEQVRTFLGETRFHQYLRSHDHDFDKLCDLIGKNGLRPQVALSVNEVQMAASLESEQVRENRTLRRKEQRLELQAIAQSTLDAIQQLLGEKVAANYSTNGGGWMVELGKQ